MNCTPNRIHWQTVICPVVMAGVFTLATLAATAQAGSLSEFRDKAREALGKPPASESSDSKDQLDLLLAIREEDEIAIGRRISSSLLAVAPLVQDKAVQTQVNRVGRWIASNSGRPGLPWRFGVIATDDINAFAAPGGIVFITRGLYRRLADEAELAGVLAHEIGHVVRKHHIKVMRKSAVLALGTDLIRHKAGGRHEEIIHRVAGQGAEWLARSLDRDAEHEADRLGVVLATRAGFDPYGLPAVLQSLATQRADDHRLALLYKTHPSPGDRLGALEQAMGDRFQQYGVARAVRLAVLR